MTQSATPDDKTVRTIMTAVQSCYGSLEDPDFRKLAAFLAGAPYRQLIDELRSSGISISETTDLNDDVSTQLVLDKAGDQVGLGLSGVGPFAALLHQDADGRYRWVTRADDAPTPLAALVAQTTERAGLTLLDRDTVMRTVKMNRADGSREATLYKTLFTDSDRIP